MRVYIPLSVYLHAMEFAPNEDMNTILTHSVQGLVRSGLIEINYSSGSREYLAKTFSDATEGGIIMAPSIHGSEVFLWGQGVKGASGHEIVDSALKLSPPEIAIPNGAQPIKG